MSITILCYLLALICFTLGAAKVQSGLNWTDAGFAFLTLSLIIK